MTTPSHDDVIEVLGCDIVTRPAGAPLPSALAPRVRGIIRSAAELAIDFATEAADDVEAFAAAESICCAGIGWRVERAPVVRLTITASPGQLDAIGELFVPA